jgi:predicted metal-dependent peptidase
MAEAGNTWGTIPGELVGLIKASLKVDLDYRKMLSLFKTSVLSSKRRLTRMRPNRRSGFDAMGSRYELSTNLLIAVDVSGSVTDKSLEFFFSVINRLFKYGIQKLDVLQFDAKIQGDVEPLKKARRTVKVLGRGGTSFQPAADYYCEHPEYDGLIYFSDGYAPSPVYNTKRPIDVLWVLCSKSAYEENGARLKELNRNRVTYIPRSE